MAGLIDSRMTLPASSIARLALVSAMFFSGLVAGELDLAHRPVALLLRPRAGFGDDLLLGRLGVAAGFFEQGPNLGRGAGQLASCAASSRFDSSCLASAAAMVGLDPLFPLQERGADLRPGERAEDRQQQQEHHEGVNGQVGPELRRIVQQLACVAMPQIVLRAVLGRRHIGDVRAVDRGERPDRQPNYPAHDWLSLHEGTRSTDSPSDARTATQPINLTAHGFCCMQMNSAKNVKPSIRAAAMIIAVWMLPATSG